ncbi:MAG: type III-B CRISPR-associated protein Cas10/Cmr2, partial [Gammaproteobacteria bacterium]|nr:type III-B CRISPR-associated protein Cas10/Cmr2 [Gammaproteobacteria bacterium]NIR84637.1 type III-B CRISPR-associated protein Cas10/Cmr2 [Gammaproteobacteria bacterium]NIU05757.1 type III-B CRISPR-associated protein Cas10/Cmr2 [Gammaproteobacteria bacterium]NIV52829.1 type III-B CRISPR-associated protein Cas10/Cmr2 [Gammaproteobacteria bacterium]NIX87030.1 type III-B CRISPR-associated protein Cas10/Cmr2 [Gammaproteobacteria bacterium]
VLSQRQGDFYAPNPGLLYDPVYDLADRTLRATKAHRPFVDLHQEGLRCSVCGEREWLTLDREQFRWTRNQRLENEKHGHGTLWTKVAKADARWASEGEHLCAHCALKRLWPDLVLDEVEGIVGKEARRFVISTRTMAFAPDLEEIAQFDEKKREKLEASPLWDRVRTHGERAALPRRIAGLLRDKGEVESFVRRLPAHLDDLRDRAESDDPETQRKGEEKLDKAESELRGLLGHAPETYYALLLMDGDRMGAWLTGGSSESIGEPLRKLDEKNTWPEDTGSGYNLPVGGSWHERVRDHVWRQFPDLRRYMLTERGASPSRHIAISEALNSFALGLARPAVDELHKGWLIYAGGDDLMAMVSVDDLLPLMTTLRSLYSGILPAGDGDPLWRDLTRPWRAKDVPKLGDGYVLFRKRLHRVMGPQATASIGAVVAHNRVPLGRVIRALRETERRAKGEGGRNAFAIRVMKRAGGEVSLVAPWYFGGQDPTALALADTPMGVLIRLRDFLAREGVSRRAAYHTFEWLRQLPRKDEVRAGYRRLVEDNLRYQLRRQAEKEEAKNEAAEVAAALTSVTFESAEDRARRG